MSEQMPQTPFLDSLGLKAPRVKLGEIREEVRRNNERVRRLLK
jgi:hypothetical protein